MSTEHYEHFFGLHEAPFSLAPNPRFLFESTSHAAALAQITYAMERREPLVVVTGEIGTGKTLLCRTVLERPIRRTFVSIINNPLLEWDDLLTQLLQDFGVISKDRAVVAAASRHDLTHALEDFLASLTSLDAHAVVVIDEAQHVRPDVLEQIRLLSNLDDANGTMLEIFLVGQPDLESLLARPELRQFQQRVSRRIRLEPLTADEVALYIGHRLAIGRAARSQMPGAKELAVEIAEWQGPQPEVTFTPDALDAIWRLSSGLPRVVNLLCDRALEAAFAQRLRIVDGAMVDTAAVALALTPAPVVLPEATAAAPVEMIAPPVIAVEPPKEASVDPPVVPVVGVIDDELAAAFAAPAAATQRADEDEFAVAFDPPIAPPREIAADAQIPAALEPAPAAAGSRTRNLAVLVAVVALAAVAAWFGMRRASQSGDSQPTGPRPTTASIPAPPVVRSEPSPPPATAPASASEPPPAAAPPEPTPPAAVASVPVAAAPVAAAPVAAAPSTPAGDTARERFDIVVASFRTEARAAAVVAQVTELGVPVRQRFSGGWQQVIAGPFASREEADAMQQRLARAGMADTHIVAASR